MKTLFVLTFNFTLLTFNLFAQWETDVRLTNDPAISATSLNNAWCIAADGNIVHVVWYEQRDGNREIYYKRSKDGGVNWGADSRLTNDPAASFLPSVAVSAQVVHVVWFDDRDGNQEIYYKRSTDGGISWGADVADTRLTNNSAPSSFPSVSVSGSVVHVVWMDDRDGGNPEIYYKRSTDGGESWEADTRLTNDPAVSEFPSVSVSGQVVHVVWDDNRDGNFEIYYKRSTDGGVSWSEDTRLTNYSAHSYSPSVSVSGLAVHVVWYDFRDGNFEIYYKRSTDGGVSWSEDTRLTNYSFTSASPSVSVSGQVVHVVWQDGRDDNWEIYYKRSDDGGVSWGIADTRLTNNSAESQLPSVAVSGSIVHVVWMDKRDDDWEIYYKRDPTGNPSDRSGITRQFTSTKNYPNPFNPTTKIQFSIPVGTGRDLSVHLKVFDVLGREVATLVNEQLKPGTYEAEWNASNYAGGIYFYRLVVDDYTETNKMVLIK